MKVVQIVKYNPKTDSEKGNLTMSRKFDDSDELEDSGFEESMDERRKVCFCRKSFFGLFHSTYTSV